MGYVLGVYPQLTETFILREMASLERRGFKITVYAIKRAGNQDVSRSLLIDRNLTAKYARPDWIFRHAFANAKAFVKRPVRYLKILMLALRQIDTLPVGQALRVLYHFLIGIGFVDAFRRERIQWLHAHFAGSDIALAAHLYCGIPFSFSAHASGDIWMNPVLLEEKLTHAELVIPVCEYNRSYLNSVSGYQFDDKLVTIHNAVAMDEASRLYSGHMPKDDPPDDSRFLVVSVGSLVRMKGHATLIRACSILERAGIRIDCEIIGEGPERETLTRIIDDLDAKKFVKLRGATSLVQAYETMSRADVFALLCEIDASGYRDGFPTVIMEAMGLGLPVVSTWISGVPELVEHGVTGLLVRERDAEQAAKAIRKILLQENLRETMGQAGRRRVEEEFNAQRLADFRAALFRKKLRARRDLPSSAPRFRAEAP